MRIKYPTPASALLLLLLLIGATEKTCSSFQSDELLVDDEDFGLEGGLEIGSPHRDEVTASPPPPPSHVHSARKKSSAPDGDSKVQFSLEHSFGGSDFSLAGAFTARLKTSSHGGQTLTKLRFSRNAFTEVEKENFRKLLDSDDFYTIRLPSNVLSHTGREYVVSSVKARCLPRDGLDEHFAIHMDGVNILGVNYGSPGSCQYPRALKVPSKWSFNSHTVLKTSEQAPRTPILPEIVGENAEGEEVKPPEKSFWAKYWMYLLPLGLIVMNAVTQAMNMAEEQTNGGQPQQQAGGAPRGQSTVVRRR
ncbi:PREDICTED: ER membrane protein complex subunit 10 [Ipomoea nil]|uniref:ER membrane protein complex subunit 10 n=1 Tax=Ipomoea nil TaxID=35883 RepID=UPI000901E2F6|nr:PREDICTED: ER membrane protein complex subunit 10 [Ipomoea nil]